MHSMMRSRSARTTNEQSCGRTSLACSRNCSSSAPPGREQVRGEIDEATHVLRIVQVSERIPHAQDERERRAAAIGAILQQMALDWRYAESGAHLTELMQERDVRIHGDDFEAALRERAGVVAGAGSEVERNVPGLGHDTGGFEQRAGAGVACGGATHHPGVALAEQLIVVRLDGAAGGVGHDCLFGEIPCSERRKR